MITIDPIKRPSKESSSVDTTEIMKEVDLKFADLIGGAPETLDTLKELADALDNSDILELLDSKANSSDVYSKKLIDEMLDASKFEWVDLGLPSGLKWATTNIGAEKPEDSGLYFAWGETEGYSEITSDKSFYWGDYKFTNAATGATDTTFRGGLTKYNNNPSSGTVDNLTVLEYVDDAAYQYDNSCRMPTKEEFQELIDNTTATLETLNGIVGKRLTSNTNGNSIFIPVTGYCSNGLVRNSDPNGYFWSSSLNSSTPKNAYYLCFNSTYVFVGNSSRNYGYTVRPVQDTNLSSKEIISKLSELIPTKISQLLNDSNYITNKTITDFQYVTSSELTLVLNSINALTEGPVLDLIDNKANKSEVPTKLSLLKNDIYKLILMLPFEGTDITTSYINLLEALLKAGLLQYVKSESYSIKAVKGDGSLIDISSADESCIAVSVAVTGGLYDQEFWILKSPRPYTLCESDDSAKGFDMLYDGFAIKKESFHYETIMFEDLPNIVSWTKDALSDLYGSGNTAHLSGEAYNELLRINSGEVDNYGYNDWYIPSIGLLIIILSHVLEINQGLQAMEVEPISIEDMWSSGVRFLSSTKMSSTDYLYCCSVGDQYSYGVTINNRYSNGYIIYIRTNL